MTAPAPIHSSTLVVVRTDPVKGRCVVAARDIPKGTRVLADPIIFVPRRESTFTDETALRRYVFEWNDEADLCVVLGLGSLINHGLPENVELESNFEDQTMEFFATTDIPAGAELVYDYGHESDELERCYGIPAAELAGQAAR